MQQKIAFISGEPDFDTLNVIKLRCDTDMDINQRIYGQAQLCRSEKSLFLRIWSFETAPTENSAVGAVFERNGARLNISVSFGKKASLLLNGQPLSDAMTSYIIQGEDLQGEYWGAVMVLPIALIFKAFSLAESDLPAKLSGNLYRENPAVSSAALKGEQLIFILESAN